MGFDGLWDGKYNGLWLGGGDAPVPPVVLQLRGSGSRHAEDEEIMGVIMAFMGVCIGQD